MKPLNINPYISKWIVSIIKLIYSHSEKQKHQQHLASAPLHPEALQPSVCPGPPLLSGFHPFHTGVPEQETLGRGQPGSGSQGSSGCAPRNVEFLGNLVFGRQNQRELVHGPLHLVLEHSDGVATRNTLTLEASWRAFH